MPKFTKLISCEKLRDSTLACGLADDGRSYVAELSQDVGRALLRELQTAAIDEMQVRRFRVFGVPYQAAINAVFREKELDF